DGKNSIRRGGHWYSIPAGGSARQPERAVESAQAIKKGEANASPFFIYSTTWTFSAWGPF
ncbi:MAG: hypothetical protein ACPGZU_20455, partial [Ketobacter sp.]